MSMTDKVLAFRDQHQLFSPADRILVAVSGGMDSVVLCALFHELKVNFGIAHCNFGLRGEESDADELFVKKLAKKYQGPYFVEHFSTQDYANQEKISIQMAARNLRYYWFEKIRQQHGFDLIATAHHQNDATETILLNLVRGTGIAGLHGILARKGPLIRPLLACTREDIYEYLVQHQLSWREDRSNEDTKYQRNLIRQEVIPVLTKLNPRLELTMEENRKKITGVEQVFQEYVEAVRKQSWHQEGDVVYLSIAHLEKATSLPLVLSEILKPFGFNFDTVENLVDAFPGIPGKQFESPTHILVKDREQLVITPKNLNQYGSYEIGAGDLTFVSPTLKLSLQESVAEGYKIPPGRKTGALDAALLQYPLRVRPWKEGDWFVPLGMKGKKKVSDFLIDEKVPANLKPRVLVLTSDKSIVWIIGYRLDNRFKVTEKTERVLELQVKN